MKTPTSIYNVAPVDCTTTDAPVFYPNAVTYMQSRTAKIAAGKAREMLWLLEHPALYTAGTSANATDLIMPERFPVFKTGRGGQYTYHGPGQRVGYFMLNLKNRGRDVRAFVAGLEDLVIGTLADFDVDAGRRAGRIGVWVNLPDGSEAKIAAIGVRIRKWVSFHGISINVCPDLSHFSGIVPCGITEHGVTSLQAMGINVSMAEVDRTICKYFVRLFGPIKD